MTEASQSQHQHDDSVSSSAAATHPHPHPLQATEAAAVPESGSRNFSRPLAAAVAEDSSPEEEVAVDSRPALGQADSLDLTPSTTQLLSDLPPVPRPGTGTPTPRRRDSYGDAGDPSGSSSPNLSTFYLPAKTPASPVPQAYAAWGSAARKEARRLSGWGAVSRSSAREGTPPPPSHPLADDTYTSSPSGSGSGARLRNVSRTTPALSAESVEAANAAAQRLRADVASPSKPDAGIVAAKRGRGRAAWGPDGAGHAALGAGDYEDNDGVELSGSYDEPRKGAGGVLSAIGLRRRSARQHEVERAESSRSASSPDNDERLHSPLGQAPSFDAGAHGSVYANKGLLETSTGVLPKPQTTMGKLARRLGFRSRDADGKRLRWNKFKWTLVVANSLLTAYSIVLFTMLMMLWANIFTHSDVVLAANQVEMRLGTAAMAMCLVTMVIGWAGILLNNRSFLSVYALFLWPCFALILAPGYIAYKRRSFNLDGKMNFLWSRNFNTHARLVVQQALDCCGYYSPYVEAAAYGDVCFARSVAQGCKGPLIRFERVALTRTYAIAFGLVPIHLFCIVVSLICGDHVTYTFGKGMTPKQYRLDRDAVGAIKGNYLTQLRDQYGHEVFPARMELDRQYSPTSMTTRPMSEAANHSSLGLPRPAFWSGASNRSSTPKSSRGSEAGTPVKPARGFP